MLIFQMFLFQIVRIFEKQRLQMEKNSQPLCANWKFVCLIERSFERSSDVRSNVRMDDQTSDQTFDQASIRCSIKHVSEYLNRTRLIERSIEHAIERKRFRERQATHTCKTEVSFLFWLIDRTKILMETKRTERNKNGGEAFADINEAFEFNLNCSSP